MRQMMTFHGAYCRDTVPFLCNSAHLIHRVTVQFPVSRCPFRDTGIFRVISAYFLHRDTAYCTVPRWTMPCHDISSRVTVHIPCHGIAPCFLRVIPKRVFTSRNLIISRVTQFFPVSRDLPPSDGACHSVTVLFSVTRYYFLGFLSF